MSSDLAIQAHTHALGTLLLLVTPTVGGLGDQVITQPPSAYHDIPGDIDVRIRKEVGEASCGLQRSDLGWGRRPPGGITPPTTTSALSALPTPLRFPPVPPSSSLSPYPQLTTDNGVSLILGITKHTES